MEQHFSRSYPFRLRPELNPVAPESPNYEILYLFSKRRLYYGIQPLYRIGATISRLDAWHGPQRPIGARQPARGLAAPRLRTEVNSKLSGYPVWPVRKGKEVRYPELVYLYIRDEPAMSLQLTDPNHSGIPIAEQPPFRAKRRRMKHSNEVTLETGESRYPIPCTGRG